MDKIEDAITDVLNRTVDFAAAKAHELRLEDERAGVKRDAILRIIGMENPLTGKAHSASSAEAIVETDSAYAAFRASQRNAVVETIRAYGALEAARLRARALTMDGVAA